MAAETSPRRTTQATTLQEVLSSKTARIKMFKALLAHPNMIVNQRSYLDQVKDEDDNMAVTSPVDQVVRRYVGIYINFLSNQTNIRVMYIMCNIYHV